VEGSENCSSQVTLHGEQVIDLPRCAPAKADLINHREVPGGVLSEHGDSDRSTDVGDKVEK
jgi:hypothetical protein